MLVYRAFLLVRWNCPQFLSTFPTILVEFCVPWYIRQTCLLPKVFLPRKVEKSLPGKEKSPMRRSGNFSGLVQQGSIESGKKMALLPLLSNHPVVCWCCPPTSFDKWISKTEVEWKSGNLHRAPHHPKRNTWLTQHSSLRAPIHRRLRTKEFVYWQLETCNNSGIPGTWDLCEKRVARRVFVSNSFFCARKYTSRWRKSVLGRIWMLFAAILE